MNLPPARPLQCGPVSTDVFLVSAHDDKPIETIRLSEDQKQRLVRQVNEHYHKPVPKERRDLRVPYHASGAVIVVLQPNGTLTRHAVLPRNLSRGGISFMIGRFMYPDCEAQVVLPERGGGTVTIGGRTLRCNHFSGMIHECAVVFNEPIDLDRFLDLSAANRETSGQMPGTQPPATAAGGASARNEPREDAPLVLIADDQKNDRRLYILWMNKLGFRAIEAESFELAVDLARKHAVEMVVVNACMAGDTGLALVKRLRSDGFAGPVLAVSADGDEAMRTHARGAGASEHLLKPFDQIDLRHAIERLMSQPGDGAGDGNAIHSELSGNDAMKPLLKEFVSGLGETVDRLTKAEAAKDADTLLALCRKLKGSGSGYGFPQITQLSLLVLDQLEMEQRDVEVLHDAVKELTAVLKRVKAE